MVLLDISSDPFFIYKNTMRISGIWPLDGPKPISAIIFSAFLSFEIADIILRVVELLGKFNVDKAFLAAWFIFGVALRINARLYGSRMIPLIESTIDDWSMITDPSERRIMKRHDKFGTLPYLIVITVFVTYPFVHDFLLSAFPSIFAKLNSQPNSKGNDNFTWDVAVPILHTVWLYLEVMMYYSVTLFIWSLTMHQCAQYHILKQQFKEFLRIQNKKERRREFRRLVQRHSELIDLSKKLEDSTNVNLAIQVLGGHILTCVLATQLGFGIRDSDFMEIAKMFLHIAFNIAIIFVYYYAGDYLTVCSEEVGDVFTQCNWYDLSNESIRDFSIVIARSRMPAGLRTAKSYKLNHKNFTNVLEGLYSYVSLMATLTKDRNN